ncbi:MAG: lycopene cyclase domain-containing protein [Bacteroidetes bacterium]|nr:MAG: lycopene cyclase domain-containing protein [Bacteroidota bacterium]
MNSHWTYAVLLLGIIAFPLSASFDKRVAFYRQWKFLFPAIIIVAVFFIAWDYWFTAQGVWRFNPAYLLGVYFFKLPLEEILFFIVVPYACVFIYACAESYFPKLLLKKSHCWISLTVMLVSLCLGLMNYDKAYTLSACVLSALLVFFFAFVQKAPWMGRFWINYAVVLIPFFICNGILTAKPVVIYNDAENLGIRMYTIPVEDLFYNLVLMLGTTGVFEMLRRRKYS